MVLFILVWQEDRLNIAMLTRLPFPIDLMPTNILLELENPNDAVSQYLEKAPQRKSLHDGTTTPLREVITTPLISEMKKPHIRIIDFGVGRWEGRLLRHPASVLHSNLNLPCLASWRGNHLSDRIQSPALRAPEVTIGAPWDTGVDIWSLGCLVSVSLSDKRFAPLSIKR